MLLVSECSPEHSISQFPNRYVAQICVVRSLLGFGNGSNMGSAECIYSSVKHCEMKVFNKCKIAFNSLPVWELCVIQGEMTDPVKQELFKPKHCFNIFN